MAVWGQPFRISQTHNKNKRSLPHYIYIYIRIYWLCVCAVVCVWTLATAAVRHASAFNPFAKLAAWQSKTVYWYTGDAMIYRCRQKKNLPQSHMWECKTLLLQSTHSAKRVNLHHLLNSMKHYIQHIIMLSFQYYVVLLAPHENFVGGVKTRSKRKSHISWWVEIEHFFSLSEKVCVSMQFILLLLLLFSRSRFIHTNNRFTHGNQINP